MNRMPSFRLTTLSLALLSLVLVAFGILNYQQRAEYQNPDDGVTWIDSPQGVTAWIVDQGGPGAHAGVHEGDQLKTINGQPVSTQAEAAQQIYRLGAWSSRPTASPATANPLTPALS
jgi:S1-C subfamily serine protease